MRLAAAYGDYILALGNDGLSGFSHDAEVAWLQVEMQLLRGTGFEVDTLEGAQCRVGRAGHMGEFQIELGHFVAARLHRVEASLPYFIPLPFLSPFGTMGAVIAMRGRIRSRNALLDIGASGPLAGLCVAIPVLIVGLLQSPMAQRFLNDLWETVQLGCTQSAEPGAAPEPGPLGLEADMTQVGPYSAVIVTLPKPLVATEAYFVAMVLRSYVRAEDGLTIDRHPLLLYYTLEHGGLGAEGSPRTLLGEWQAGVLRLRLPDKGQARREDYRIHLHRFHG